MGSQAAGPADVAARVLPRVTRRLVSFVFICYVVAYIDRVNVGFVSTILQRELGLSNQAYGFGAGLFFLGYFLFEIPSNLILERVGARRWIARIMIVWGFVSMGMIFVTGERSFYLLRFLLGLAEAGFFPGIVLYLTYWIPTRERARNGALFMTAAPVAMLVGAPVSEALLGRDSVHWSFFVDSDASVMEGNDIADLGGGSFRTVAAVRRFSPLDQYAMGLVAESDVPAFFYVESPVNVSPSVEADSAPRIGVTFNGTRRDVLIQDIVAVMGRRVPGSSTSPRVHRQAFLFVRSRGGTVDPAQVAKIDRIRRTWESFFVDATDGRMRAETRLRPPS